MFCKDCGKEMKDGTTLCPECGTKTESSNVKQVSNEMPVSDTNMSVIAPEMSKKKYPLKLVIGAIITAILIIIIVIACAVGGDDSENLTIVADNYNGMSFNYDVSEWCDNFNEAIKEVSEEYDIKIDLNINTSSFKLDNTDSDPTDANVVRYYYENSKNNTDFAISLHVDTDTEKVCKCDIVNAPVSGDDLTLFEHFCLIPAVMATSHINYDTACSIMGDVFLSDNHTYYSNNICYQFGSTSTYDITSIQTVSQEAYDEKY